MKPIRNLLLALCLCATTAHAAEQRRVLHVSLYPYIPDAAAAALALKQGFEDSHPDVIVKITFNPNYYSPVPADKGVLYEDADVHEIDVVFLRDFLDQHKLAALPKDFTATLDKLDPLAAEAATNDGALVAVPQWMCTDFLIYRSGIPGLADAHSLADLESSLVAPHGLLMDMKGGGTLGELYLSTLLARDGAPGVALSHVTPKPDPAILARLRRILALEPAGFGRNAAYDAQESFYARQFARGAGAAFVGYSEMTHEVLDESALSCTVQEHCVTADQIGVAAFPFWDGKVHPAVWVDMFGIDSRVHGAAFRDAEDFIRYAVSLSAYRALLVPEPGEPPRYLLPATQAALDDATILRAAPLMPKFRAIIDRGAVVRVPNLNAVLHEVAAQIDADLPAIH